MANKTSEIKFLGLSNSPSDYDCGDGNLSLAINVLHENGAIKSAAPSAPKIKVSLGEGKVVVFQHEGNFIVKDNDGLYKWIDSSATDTTGMIALEGQDGSAFVSISSLGNYLIASDGEKMYHYRWVAEEGEESPSYHFTGNKVPDIELSFGLTSHAFDYYTYRQARRSKDKVTVKLEGSFDRGKISNADIDSVTNGTMAVANVFTGEWADENGYFTQPFLVRYALRMSDGSVTNVSAPVLMIPASGNNPIVFVSAYGARGNMELGGVGFGCSLFMKLLNQDQVGELAKWKDLVKSVDIFVSAPIYTYNQDGRTKEYSGKFPLDLVGTGGADADIENVSFQFKANNAYTVSKHFNERFEVRTGDGYNILFDRYKGISNIIEDYRSAVITDTGSSTVLYFNGQKFANVARDGSKSFEMSQSYNDPEWAFLPPITIDLDTKDDETIIEEVKNTSLFYLVKSFSIDELIENDNKDIKFSKGVLNSLVTKEILQEDYDGKHTLVPSGISEYNQRINLFDIKKKFFEGFDPAVALTECNNQSLSGEHINIYKTVVFINNTETKIRLVKDDCSDVLFRFDTPIQYWYYPDPSAYKIVLYARNSAAQGQFYKAELPLHPHPTLNGAVYFKMGEYENIWESHDGHTFETPTDVDYQELKSVVYTSNVTNPFVFKAANVEQVGSGQIIALAPVTLPLSEGQYGFAEMYCFTTDGIWALKVSGTGGWSAKQPFHYDVLLDNNASNILRMERDILFSSARGLMILAGNKVESISEIFDGEKDGFLSGKAWSQQFYTSWLNAFKSKILTKIWSGKDAIYRAFNYYEEFNKFIGNAVYLYDYPHQRVIVGNPDYSVSFVLNITDRVWTTIPIKILSAVNSYPQCYANVYDEYNNSNILVDFAADSGDFEMPNEGVLVTRPIKLNSPTIQKTMRTVNLQGQFNKDHASIILLGCNDNALMNWFVAGSSKGSRLPFVYGTPFKFFRIIVVTNLEKDETISSAMVEYEFKELNKERQ